MKPGNYYIKKKSGLKDIVGEAVVMSDDYVMTTFWETVRAPAMETTVEKLQKKYHLEPKVKTETGSNIEKSVLDIMKQHGRKK